MAIYIKLPRQSGILSDYCAIYCLTVLSLVSPRFTFDNEFNFLLNATEIGKDFALLKHSWRLWTQGRALNKEIN